MHGQADVLIRAVSFFRLESDNGGRRIAAETRDWIEQGCLPHVQTGKLPVSVKLPSKSRETRSSETRKYGDIIVPAQKQLARKQSLDFEASNTNEAAPDRPEPVLQ